MIYLDNNATTKIDEEVLKAMMPFLEDKYGNPSSLYSFGVEVKNKIKEARINVAKMLNANDSEIIFTSCASESNNTAIMSCVRSYPNKKHIITTPVEHSSILEPLRYLQSQGYKITYLPVDDKGRLDITDLNNIITDDTLLVTVMVANNEIGNIYPVDQIGKIAKEKGVIFHVDAVQAIGKTDINVDELNIDMLSLSGHKINAPKGVGVLYVREGTPFIPYLFGGHQENGKRGGTENTASIIGLGKAAELIISDNLESNKNIARLRDYLEKEIKENIDGVTIYGDLENRLPNTTNIAFDGIRGEELMIMLEQNGILASTGSACNSSDVKPSHVLMAIHADLEKSSPIRISLSKYNTEEEMEKTVRALKIAVNTLRKRGGS